MLRGQNDRTSHKKNVSCSCCMIRIRKEGASNSKAYCNVLQTDFSGINLGKNIWRIIVHAQHSPRSICACQMAHNWHRYATHIFAAVSQLRLQLTKKRSLFGKHHLLRIRDPIFKAVLWVTQSVSSLFELIKTNSRIYKASWNLAIQVESNHQQSLCSMLHHTSSHISGAMVTLYKAFNRFIH